jgi:hypothetical protein
MKITHIADLRRDNSLITPVQMLRAVADDIESGERKVCKRAIVLLVDDDPHPDGQAKFWLGWAAANIPCSVALAALECFKAELLQSMGFACDTWKRQ